MGQQTGATDGIRLGCQREKGRGDMDQQSEQWLGGGGGEVPSSSLWWGFQQESESHPKRTDYGPSDSVFRLQQWNQPLTNDTPSNYPRAAAGPGGRGTRVRPTALRNRKHACGSQAVGESGGPVLFGPSLDTGIARPVWSMLSFGGPVQLAACTRVGQRQQGLRTI